MSKPLISVVIPTFNRSHCVGNAIESVLRQTYQAIELIVVDDGSIDDTRATLERFGSRLRCIYQPNQGVSGALNTGILAASGDWVAILSSDDTWHPQKLDIQWSALQGFERPVQACFTNVSFTGTAPDRPSALVACGYQIGGRPTIVEDPLSWLLARQPIFFVQSLLVCRTLVEGSCGFDRSLRTSEDNDLCFRLALRTPFCMVPEPLVYIDAAPNRTDKLSRNAANDREYAIRLQDALLSKWLNVLPSDAPAGWRYRLESTLRSHRYEALVYRLKCGDWRATLEAAKALQIIGESPARIVRALVKRKLAAG